MAFHLPAEFCSFVLSPDLPSCLPPGVWVWLVILSIESFSPASETAGVLLWPLWCVFYSVTRLHCVEMYFLCAMHFGSNEARNKELVFASVETQK